MSKTKHLSELRCPECGSSSLTAKKNENTHKFEITCSSCSVLFDPEEAATSEKDFQKKKESIEKQKRWIKSVIGVVVFIAIAMAYLTFLQIKEAS